MKEESRNNFVCKYIGGGGLTSADFAGRGLPSQCLWKYAIRSTGSAAVHSISRYDSYGEFFRSNLPSGVNELCMSATGTIRSCSFSG